jgi:hypothetical protein
MQSRRKSVSKIVCKTVVAIGLAFASTAAAQEAQEAQEAQTQGEPRLLVHGYLTQAYAASDGEQLLGIPEEGTWDYRRLALQFQYAATDNDKIVVQLAQRRLGDSPLGVLEPNVKLDWAYYEHRFKSRTAVRVGRFPVPRGLLNEIRYVGTLLPFYRVPYNVYQEGSFTSETLDGAQVRQTIGRGAWSLELDAYAGGSSMLELATNGANESPAKKAFGGQLALTTPIEGLKLVGGGQRFDLRRTILAPDGRDTMSSWNVGGEYVHERFKIRAEYAPIFVKKAGIEHPAYYVYGGLWLTSRWAVHGQLDQADITLKPAPGVTVEVEDFHHDLAAGTTYAFRPDVVAKAEYHWTRTRRTEANGAARELNPGVDADRADYFILSLSAAF